MRQILFVVDVTRTPNETTDTLPDGKHIKGIDKHDGDTLTRCVPFFTLGISIQNPKSKIQNCLLTGAADVRDYSLPFCGVGRF